MNYDMLFFFLVTSMRLFGKRDNSTERHGYLDFYFVFCSPISLDMTDDGGCCLIYPMLDSKLICVLMLNTPSSNCVYDTRKSIASLIYVYLTIHILASAEAIISSTPPPHIFRPKTSR